MEGAEMSSASQFASHDISGLPLSTEPNSLKRSHAAMEGSSTTEMDQYVQIPGSLPAEMMIDASMKPGSNDGHYSANLSHTAPSKPDDIQFPNTPPRSENSTSVTAVSSENSKIPRLQLPDAVAPTIHPAIDALTPQGTPPTNLFSTPDSSNLSPPASMGQGTRNRITSRGGKFRNSRGGTRAGAGKRRRDHSGGASARFQRPSTRDGERSSSEEITSLPAQSRSGRRITQTTTAAAAAAARSTLQQISRADFSSQLNTFHADPANKRAIRSANNPSSPRSARKRASFHLGGANQKRASAGHGTSPNAVCKNCQRGHSPHANAIVFCDGCNSPWHQHCHDPPIKAALLEQVEKEWHCGDCTFLREEGGRLKGRVSGTGMSLYEKRKYLQSLTSSTLVSLLLHASALHPSLPLFQPRRNYSQLLPPAPSSQPPTPNAKSPSVPVEEEENLIYEEEELPYPRAGNGIKVPAESDFLHLLVEDAENSVFSHRWEGIADMVAEGMKLNDEEARRSGGTAGLGVRVGNSVHV